MENIIKNNNWRNRTELALLVHLITTTGNAWHHRATTTNSKRDENEMKKKSKTKCQQLDKNNNVNFFKVWSLKFIVEHNFKLFIAYLIFTVKCNYVNEKFQSPPNQPNDDMIIINYLCRLRIPFGDCGFVTLSDFELCGLSERTNHIIFT